MWVWFSGFFGWHLPWKKDPDSSHCFSMFFPLPLMVPFSDPPRTNLPRKGSPSLFSSQSDRSAGATGGSVSNRYSHIDLKRQKRHGCLKCHYRGTNYRPFFRLWYISHIYSRKPEFASPFCHNNSQCISMYQKWVRPKCLCLGKERSQQSAVSVSPQWHNSKRNFRGAWEIKVLSSLGK